MTEINTLAKEISSISRKELGHLYYSSREIAKALEENRYAMVTEGEKIAAFGFWRITDGPPRLGEAGWAEFHTLYIYPEFRGQGYLGRLFEVIYQRLKDANLRAFFFTRAGAVEHTAVKYGFRKGSMSEIPFVVLIRALKHHLHPRRWTSYLKYGWRILGAWNWSVYIR